MIEINGKKLDLEAKAIKSEFYGIEGNIKSAWAFLNERHNLSKGKNIDLLMFDEFKRKRQMSSMDGEQFTTVKNYPAGTQISLTAMVNYKGTPYEVRYFKTKRPTKQDNVFEYKPTSLMITGDTHYAEKDKELILFFYLFSGLIKNKPNLDKQKYSLETTLKPKFYFNDVLVLAQHKNERRSMIAKGTIMIEDLTDDRVKIFASINGIDETLHMDVIRDRIITLIEKHGEEMFTKLQDFVIKYDDSIYGINELVNSVMRKKMIKSFYLKEKNDEFIEWWYMKDSNKDTMIMRHSGNEKKLSAVVDYMASDNDALIILRNKYNNISK